LLFELFYFYPKNTEERVIERSTFMTTLMADLMHHLQTVHTDHPGDDGRLMAMLGLRSRRAVNCSSARGFGGARLPKDLTIPAKRLVMVV